MATNNLPTDKDDAAYLIVIVLLCAVLVGFAPILIDMYFETKMEKEQNRIDRKEIQRQRREVDEMKREVQRMIHEKT